MWLPWAALTAWLLREVRFGRNLNDDALSPDERARRARLEDGDEEQVLRVTADLAAGSTGT